MKNYSLKMLSLAAGFALFGGLTAQAQDKATLDLLVKKGVITQSDADDVAKSSAAMVVVTPKDAAVKGLKLEGVIQTQFDSISTNDKSAASTGNPPATNEFFVRRAYLGALADLGNGFGGEIVFDFAAGAQAPSGYLSNGSNAAQNSFEKIIITKKFDDYYGLFTAGYQKVNFTMEEYTSSAVIKPIERSVVSRYFDESYKGANSRRIGFANRHNGVYWDGKIPAIAGLAYGVALTNGIQNSSGYPGSTGAVGSATYLGGLNRPSFWAYTAYTGAMGDFGYKAGLNYGYSSDGNTIVGQANSIWGYNPVLTLTYGKSFQLDAEFLQTFVSNGAVNGGVTQRASPYGFNITPSYKITPEWELVARYSMLNTNGRGTTIADVVRDGADISGAATPVFNDVSQFYVGVNWYLVGNSVKASLGYEFSQFNNRGVSATGASSFTGARAEVDGIRARLQLLF